MEAWKINVVAYPTRPNAPEKRKVWFKCCAGLRVPRHLDLSGCKSSDVFRLANIICTTVSYYLMSRKFKIRDQEAVHFVTFTNIQWLDPPVFQDGVSQHPGAAREDSFGSSNFFLEKM